VVMSLVVYRVPVFLKKVLFLSKALILPIICNNFETVRKRMQVSYNH